jgi:hypothetical protein
VHRLAIIAVTLAAACGSSGSGFAGDYEAVELTTQHGGCGERTADTSAHDLFRLDDVDTANGALIGYYPCAAIGTCDELYDLSLSFGRAKDDPDGWAGYVSTAIPTTPCQLSYRVRTLSADDRGIAITEQVFRDTDPALTGAACNSAAASARGDGMPCVDDSLTIAEDR